MEPTLTSLLYSQLQWIFVGGKGGVGKTTTCCALATLFATTVVPVTDSATGTTTQRPRRVLLLSTDPAHNLSDAFNQAIGKTPTPITGLETTLSAMEIDPTNFTHGEFYGHVMAKAATTAPSSSPADGANSSSSGGGGGGNDSLTPASNSSVDANLFGVSFSAVGAIIREAAAALPGIDELAVFAEILRSVQELAFDVVLFDTAPTGHTLHLLALPQTLNTTMDKLMGLEGVAPLVEAATGMLTSTVNANTGSVLDSAHLKEMAQHWREQVRMVQSQFNDTEKTAFVCVCIPEFLSVYETERLIQQLMKYNITCESLVVNQLVMKPSSEPPCRMCAARQKVQAKYLAQIDALYEDFHVVRMPLLSDEVRGVAALQQFARFLMEPYNPDEHGYLDMASC